MPYRYDPNKTNGEHEIFETPTPEPQDWWQGTARSWPNSSLTTTTPEEIRQQTVAQQREDKLDELPPLGSLDSDWAEIPIDGVADAVRTPMSFFAGKSHAEGRAAYNAHRISRGQAPIPEGKR